MSSPSKRVYLMGAQGELDPGAFPEREGEQEQAVACTDLSSTLSSTAVPTFSDADAVPPTATMDALVAAHAFPDLTQTLQSWGFSEAQIRYVKGDNLRSIDRSQTWVELWAQWFATHHRDDSEFFRERGYFDDVGEWVNLDELLTERKKTRILNFIHAFDVWQRRAAGGPSPAAPNPTGASATASATPKAPVP